MKDDLSMFSSFPNMILKPAHTRLDIRVVMSPFERKSMILNKFVSLFFVALDRCTEKGY